MRTPHSERYTVTLGDKPLAFVDVHLFADGTLEGTLILLEDSGVSEKDVSVLLRELEENYLPGVTLGEGTLVYAVVSGRLLGSYESMPTGYAAME